MIDRGVARDQFMETPEQVLQPGASCGCSLVGTRTESTQNSRQAQPARLQRASGSRRRDAMRRVLRLFPQAVALPKGFPLVTSPEGASPGDGHSAESAGRVLMAWRARPMGGGGDGGLAVPLPSVPGGPWVTPPPWAWSGFRLDEPAARPATCSAGAGGGQGPGCCPRASAQALQLLAGGLLVDHFLHGGGWPARAGLDATAGGSGQSTTTIQSRRGRQRLLAPSTSSGMSKTQQAGSGPPLGLQPCLRVDQGDGGWLLAAFWRLVAGTPARMRALSSPSWGFRYVWGQKALADGGQGRAGGAVSERARASVSTMRQPWLRRCRRVGGRCHGQPQVPWPGRDRSGRSVGKSSDSGQVRVCSGPSSQPSHDAGQG